jgi:hypothetical protein
MSATRQSAGQYEERPHSANLQSNFSANIANVFS